MFLVVGLGNPGQKYTNTRHNLGFLFLDALRENLSFPAFSTEKKFQAKLSSGTLQKTKILLVKPQTSMNLSGKSVQKIMNYHNSKEKDLLVVHDDKDIPLGETRFATDSTSAGHKGVQNIIDCLGTKKFFRLRIGIKQATCVDKNKVADFVLGKMEKKELEIISSQIEKELLVKVKDLILLQSPLIH